MSEKISCERHENAYDEGCSDCHQADYLAVRPAPAVVERPAAKLVAGSSSVSSSPAVVDDPYRRVFGIDGPAAVVETPKPDDGVAEGFNRLFQLGTRVLDARNFVPFAEVAERLKRNPDVRAGAEEAPSCPVHAPAVVEGEREGRKPYKEVNAEWLATLDPGAQGYIEGLSDMLRGARAEIATLRAENERLNHQLTDARMSDRTVKQLLATERARLAASEEKYAALNAEVGRAYGEILKAEDSVQVEPIDAAMASRLARLKEAEEHHDEHHAREDELAARLARAEQERDGYRQALEGVSMAPWAGRDGYTLALVTARYALGQVDPLSEELRKQMETDGVVALAARIKELEQERDGLKQVWLPCDQTVQCAICLWVDWDGDAHPETCPVGAIDARSTRLEEALTNLIHYTSKWVANGTELDAARAALRGDEGEGRT